MLKQLPNFSKPLRSSSVFFIRKENFRINKKPGAGAAKLRTENSLRAEFAETSFPKTGEGTKFSCPFHRDIYENWYQSKLVSINISLLSLQTFKLMLATHLGCWLRFLKTIKML